MVASTYKVTQVSRMPSIFSRVLLSGVSNPTLVSWMARAPAATLRPPITHEEGMVDPLMESTLKQSEHPLKQLNLSEVEIYTTAATTQGGDRWLSGIALEGGG